MENREEIVQHLYDKGFSCRQIAGELHISCHKTVASILSQRGVILRNASEAQRLRHPSKIFPFRERIVHFCSKCNNTVSNRNNLLCRECWRRTNKGEDHPSWKGGKPSCKGCGVPLSSYSLKKNLCRSCHDVIKGPNHWNWKGGKARRILNNREYKEWRTAVFERDEYTCQRCHTNGGYLNAHHIVRWCDSEEKRFDIDNGLTLCKTCHKLEHGWHIKHNELLTVKSTLWGP